MDVSTQMGLSAAAGALVMLILTVCVPRLRRRRVVWPYEGWSGEAEPASRRKSTVPKIRRTCEQAVQTYVEPDALPLLSLLALPPTVEYLPTPLRPPLPPPPPFDLLRGSERYSRAAQRAPGACQAGSLSVGVSRMSQTDGHDNTKSGAPDAPIVVHRQMQTDAPPRCHPASSQTHALPYADATVQTSDARTPSTTERGSAASPEPRRAGAAASAIVTAATSSAIAHGPSSAAEAAEATMPPARPVVVPCTSATQTGEDLGAGRYDAACETMSLERRSAGVQTHPRLRDAQAKLLSLVGQEVGPAATAMVPRALLWMDAEWRETGGVHGVHGPQEERSLLPLIRAMEEEIGRLHKWARTMSAPGQQEPQLAQLVKQQ